MHGSIGLSPFYFVFMPLVEYLKMFQPVFVIAAFGFVVAVWRMTRIPGFALLALIMAISQAYQWSWHPLLEKLGHESFNYFGVCYGAVIQGLLALAYWNIYSRLKRLLQEKKV